MLSPIFIGYWFSIKGQIIINTTYNIYKDGEFEVEYDEIIVNEEKHIVSKKSIPR